MKKIINNIMNSAILIIENKIQYNKFVIEQLELKNKNTRTQNILKEENSNLKNAVKAIKNQNNCW